MEDGSDIEINSPLEGAMGDPNMVEEEKAKRLQELEQKTTSYQVHTAEELSEKMKQYILRFNNLKGAENLSPNEILERQLLEIALKLQNPNKSAELTAEEFLEIKQILTKKETELKKLEDEAKERNLTADEVSKRMVLETEINRLKNPIVREKPPSEVGAEVYAQAKTEGHLYQFEVVEEVDNGGSKGLRLKDPETGKTFILKVGVRAGEIVGAGVIPDIEPSYNEAQLTAHIDGLVEYYEVNYTLLNRQLIDAYLNNLAAYAGIGIDPDSINRVKNELKDKLKYRLNMAMIAYHVDFGMVDDYQASFANFGRDGIEYIGITIEKNEKLQIRNVIKKLEADDGEIYRVSSRGERIRRENQILCGLDGDWTNPSDPYWATTPRPAIPGGEVGYLMAAPPAGLGLTEAEAIKKAKLSLELGKKLLLTTGHSSFYGGSEEDTPAGPGRPGKLIERRIIDKMVTNHVPGFSVDPITGETKVDLTQEEYWSEWNRIRLEEGIRIIKPTIPGEPYFGHDVPALFKPAFYGPEVLAENNFGKAKGLRIAAETRARSFVLFKGHTTLEGLIESIDTEDGALPDKINNVGLAEPFRWSIIASGGAKMISKFYKEDPFFLNDPLPNANEARRSTEGLVKSLGNLYKMISGENYGYLDYYRYGGEAAHMAYNIRAKLVQETLRYVNSNEGKDLFIWLGWNQGIQLEAISILIREKGLRAVDAKAVIDALKVNRTLAAGYSALPELTQGVRTAAAGFWSGITGGKR